MLFSANIAASPGENPPGPLHFLGVEMSAYAIAKAHVIWEMLKQTAAPSSPKWKGNLRQVLQAWFSATWEEGTSEVVKQALTSLCSSQQSYHPDVHELLNHWIQAPPLRLSEARAHIMRATTDSLSGIGHLRKKRDRIALAKYELTRDFAIGGDGIPSFGNILMFDCPDGTPPLMKDETVFSAFQWHDLMEVLRKEKRMNVVQAAEHYALCGIEKMAKWAQAGSVTVELKFAAVQDIVEEIAVAKPWTMSWSNVLDYLDYSGFHNLARACSIHGDTIHYGYSMNWSTEVFGTSVIDFAGRQQSEIRSEIFDTANKCVHDIYKAIGWDQHLRTPPPTSPLNTSQDYCLGQAHYREWVSFFFNLTRRDGPVKVANVEHAIGSPLSTTGASTVAFTWTYDPDIQFNGLHPFLGGL